VNADARWQHRNDERLFALKDRHKGRRGVVCGSGPSLQIEDLVRLKDDITFASNRIFLAFDQTGWRPSYYTMCDAVVARDNREKVIELPLNKVFGWSVVEQYRDDPDATFVNCPRKEDEKDTYTDEDGIVRMKGAEKPAAGGNGCGLRCWLRAVTGGGKAAESIESLKNDTSWPLSWNLLRGAKAGHSVVNLGLKIAYWMGIREVVVIGCDHNFSVPDTRTGEKVFKNEVIRSENEVNHFHPDYRKRGEEWTLPKLDVMAGEFAYARRVFETDGGRIINASRFSKLEVWERGDFDALFPETGSR
jgi:hypothetical protein